MGNKPLPVPRFLRPQPPLPWAKQDAETQKIEIPRPEEKTMVAPPPGVPEPVSKKPRRLLRKNKES